MTPTTSPSSPPTGPRNRRARIRRTLLVSAAALVVVSLPTACDYAIAAEQADRSAVSAEADAARHSGHGGQTRVAATSSAAPDSAADSASATAGDDGDSQDSRDSRESSAAASSSASSSGSSSGSASGASGNQQTNGLDVLARDCSESDLEPHTGFQDGNRCVDTAFGEVGSADDNPTLLITSAPRSVPAGQSFELKVSTRNLVRDRFLGAAAGGYYLEASVLNADGIQRGHFHTACRMLPSTDTAPDAAPEPEFFLATQDNKGGAGADTVTITVPGLTTKGVAQCSSWAGDGSHRIPMMQRANQTPAFDSVRVEIT